MIFFIFFMRITVTTSPKTLDEILSPSQQAQATTSKKALYYHLVLQNLGSTSVYVEHGGAATVSTGVQVLPGVGSLDIEVKSFADLSLISEDSSNDNIRILSL